ncbi:thioredoxin family protein [Methanobrevibacter sp.]|uniref:thioredoxin family protein n=1 Tax=Methanobrevibacter sp. TaxID=66852 RepID=UPI003891132A
MSDAQSQNKSIILIFDQDGCYYCDLLKENTLSNKELISKLKGGYITVIVDINKNPQLAAKYQVFGTPTMIFLDSNQKQIGKIDGYVEANEFLNYIKGM